MVCRKWVINLPVTCKREALRVANSEFEKWRLKNNSNAVLLGTKIEKLWVGFSVSKDITIEG